MRGYEKLTKQFESFFNYEELTDILSKKVNQSELSSVKKDMVKHQ